MLFGRGALTMVSGKAYKGGPMWSVLKVATTPSPPQTKSRKLSKNAAENEAFIGATLPGAKRRMEGWTQFEPNDILSLRAEYIPRNLDASVFLQCSMFFAPYTDQQIVSLCDKNFLSFRFDSSKSNHTAWHWRRRRLKSTCLILRHEAPIDLIWREYYNPVSQELAVWKKIISMSFSPFSFFLSAMLDC